MQNPGSITLSAASVLTVAGNLTLSTNSTLAVQFGGAPATGLFGQLNVQNALTLGGTLNLADVNGFGPTLGQVYNVAGFGTTSGSFATIVAPLAGGNPLLSPSFTATAMTVSALLTAADLEPTSITAPPTALVGQPLTVSYQVTNLQATPTLASSWTDNVYLSTDGTIDTSSILLQSVPHTGVVAANGTYSTSITVPTPAVLPGNFSIVVQVDAGGAVPDSDRANNVAVSSAGVAVDFPSLGPGTPVATTIAAGQDLYYRIDAPAGSDLAVLARRCPRRATPRIT